ncbi:hypothetical protein X946_5950 [Burkholderia sp. ABCPW 111]|nr:hypothetical protein X946_5950 [Burkholderia sp. ABCPW 111]
MTVRIGNDAMMRTFVQSAVHVNTGIFISVMPGARIRRMVTKKFTPVSNVPTPDICSAHK